MRLFRRMYRNVGKKICFIAKLLGFISLFALVAGFVMFVDGIIVLECGMTVSDDMLIFGAIASGAGLAGFILSYFLYAFGQITHDVHRLKNMMGEDFEKNNTQE